MIKQYFSIKFKSGGLLLAKLIFAQNLRTILASAEEQRVKFFNLRTILNLQLHKCRQLATCILLHAYSHCSCSRCASTNK